jgi:S-adenosylmethionine:tRNA ribosyltransferase-isomerase
LLNPGDCLVINDTKVIPARLIGIKEGGGANVEVLLLKRLEDDRWEALVYPGRRLKEGARVTFGDGSLQCVIESVTDDGNRIVCFEYEGIFEEILDKLGQMPLPPYITETLIDKDRYQTVYAKYSGSAAAPTAGLHFTNELLDRLTQKGVNIAKVTLHVGLGTFRPVKEDDLLNHKMHSEYAVIDKSQADIINNAKESGKRVIAVGTTSARTLESFNLDKRVVPDARETDIFIYPGYEFQIIDGLITNFHLPESTLIMLVSAFTSREIILNAYNEAVREKYRFFSFGDAMFIV